MSARIADVRKHMPFIAFMASDHLAVVTLHHYLLTLNKCTQTFAWIHSPKGYILTQHARANMDVFHALLYIGQTILNMSDCIGGRVGQGIMTIPGLYGITESVLIWYHPATPELYQSLTVNPASMLYLNHIFENSGAVGGEQSSNYRKSISNHSSSWQDIVWFQLLNSVTISAAKMKHTNGTSSKSTPVSTDSSVKMPSPGDNHQDTSIRTSSTQRSVPQMFDIPEDDVAIDDAMIDAVDIPVSSGDIPIASAGSRSRSSHASNGNLPAGSRSRDSSSELRHVSSTSQQSSQRTPVLTNSSDASTIRTQISAGSVGTRTMSQPVSSNQSAITGQIAQSSNVDNVRSRSRSSHRSSDFRSNSTHGERTTSQSSNGDSSRSRSNYCGNGNDSGEQYSPTVTMQSDHSSLVTGNNSTADSRQSEITDNPNQTAEIATSPDEDSDSDATIPDPSSSDYCLHEYCWYEIANRTRPPIVPAWYDSSFACTQLSQQQAEHIMQSVSCDADVDVVVSRSPSNPQAIEFEIPSYLAKWLVDPVDVPSGCVLVYTVESSTDNETGSTTTKRVIERDFDALTPQETKKHWHQVASAIRKELQSFTDLNVFKAVPVQSVSNIMTSRWVLRWKMIDGVKTVKARLTVRGFEDLSASTVETYANTATRWGQRLICSAAVQQNWELFTWDISTAFLQGISFEELAQITGTPVRQVAMRPPKGTEQFFKEMPGLNVSFDTHVLLMLKAVYGLKDAPRAWRIR